MVLVFCFGILVKLKEVRIFSGIVRNNRIFSDILLIIKGVRIERNSVLYKILIFF